MTEPGSQHVILKLAVLVLIVAALGLPINNLWVYGLLAAAALIAFTGIVTTRTARWLAAAVVALLVFAQHTWLGAPRIEEGHNVFLVDGAGSGLERGLPAGAFRAMAERFDAAYPPERRCERGSFLCWRPRSVPDRVFAFASDGALGRPAYSRRVTGIDFESPIWLRLGVINDGSSLNFVGKDGDVERAWRDKRSLAVFGRWQSRLPWFVMYRFPADFAGSSLCWRGEVLWEGANEQFATLQNKDWACRTLMPEDIGRRVFGVAIGPAATLAMSLDAPLGVTLRRALDAATAALGVIGVLLLLVRWQPRRMVFPLLLMAPALLIVVLIDITFIGGYRPLDGGDDGLIFSGFARQVVQALAHGDLMTALRGGENVYGFTAGMRYARAAEYLAFGDTFLGYLGVMLILPLIVFTVAARFIGTRWALVFALVFVVTPLGALFGTSYLHFVVWSARGFADPLAATAFLAGLALLAGPIGMRFDPRATPAFFGAMLMAIAVVIRPNLVLGAAVLLAGTGLAALFALQWRRVTALCIGFVPVLFPLWHNWYFGNVVVLFSDILTNTNIYMVPPVTYWNALGEIARLNLFGENLALVSKQFALWLSGPTELRIMIPLHVAAIAVLFRVAFSGNFEPMLRLTALATLALAPPAFIYLISVRYHLALWLLSATVVAAWIKIEGLVLIDRWRPDLRDNLAQSRAVAGLTRALARLWAFAGLEGRPATS